MSLNEINLSPFLVAQLYSKSLIDDRASAPQKKNNIKKEGTTENTWKSLGNNKKKVLVVVNYSDAGHLPDQQLEFLLNLLKACQLSLIDIVLINLNNYKDVEYTLILNHFNPRICLLFGVTTAAFGFPFEIPQYQVQQFTDYTVIHSPELGELQNDKKAKSQLWISLKAIFNL